MQRNRPAKFTPATGRHASRLPAIPSCAPPMPMHSNQIIVSPTCARAYRPALAQADTIVLYVTVLGATLFRRMPPHTSSALQQFGETGEREVEC